jgi:hypothetical protein
MSNIIGAALGALIDRQDGDSGVKGAIVGSLSQRVLAAAIPIVTVVAIGWAIEHSLISALGTASERND